MVLTPLGARTRPVRREAPLHRLLVPVLAALLALLSGAITAPAAVAAPPSIPDSDWLRPVAFGHDLHVPILIYRTDHPEVRPGRNVADFFFPGPDGDTWCIVAPSVPEGAGSSVAVPIEIYRKDPSSPRGWTRVGGDTLDPAKPFGDLPDLSEVHAEKLAYLYLRYRMNGANALVYTGVSERMLCDVTPNNCRTMMNPNLRTLTLPDGTEMGRWFPGIYNPALPMGQRHPMLYLVKGTTKQTRDALKAGMDEWVALGQPFRNVRAVMASAQAMSVPGSGSAQGAVAQALAPGSDPGGIDFSTLQLRYLTEGSGGQLEYAFDASATTASDHKVADGRIALTQSSDAFFVWLSLPPSTFWVNLNPTEPDRIVDAKLGTTDVGRILLQADFQMKKVVGQLINPNTPTGQQFWGANSLSAPGGSCIDMRQWIVPKPATVYEQNGGLYIVDAPLEVKMETDYLKQQGVQGSCTTPDARMEATFRTMVLPKVEDAVNHSPDFAELRRVYLSRVAAEWYRQKHSRGGLLSSLIDSNDVSAWPALQSWSPRQVFDQYVDSYNKKEFNITKQYTQGDTVYTQTYTYGGVDFSNVVLHAMAPGVFQQQHPGASQAVQHSYQQPTQNGSGTLLLGGTSHPVLPGNLNDPAMTVPVATSRPSFWYVAATPLVLWLIAGALLVVRRRRLGADPA
jgi:hypothetical protein